jgi:hypothetical protein
LRPYGIVGVSTDSQYSHFAWAQQGRKQGGIGPDLKLPLIADRNMNISKEYGVLIEEEGIALRGLFIIDPKGIVRLVCASIVTYFIPTLNTDKSPSMIYPSVDLWTRPSVFSRPSNLWYEVSPL